MRKHGLKTCAVLPAAFLFLLLLWSGSGRLMVAEKTDQQAVGFHPEAMELFFSPAGSYTADLNKAGFGGEGHEKAVVQARIEKKTDSGARQERLIRDSNGNTLFVRGDYRTVVFQAFPPETGFV